jgi:hypothetical protein
MKQGPNRVPGAEVTPLLVYGIYTLPLYNSRYFMQRTHSGLPQRVLSRTPRSEGYLVKAASLSTKCRSLQINGTGNRNWGYSCAS